MRALLKFLHTIGGIGFLGGMACLVVMLAVLPDPASLATYAEARKAMAAVAQWVLFPSLGLTLIAGLLALGFNRAFHNAGWAWIKAASGILLFESGFVGVLGPMQREAEQSAKALAGAFDPALLGLTLNAERNTLWILIAIAVANVVLGIWRPRLARRSRHAE
jgi:hypothetical protein